MKPIAALLAALLLAAPAVAAEPISVMVIASFHMSNPGHDLHNITADDVLSPKRQAELAVVSDGLARFKPTMVAVEWPADKASQRYSDYSAGTLNPSRSEAVQLGFRLAKQVGLSAVYGIDEMTDFPYEAVTTYGKAHGMQPFLDDLSKAGTAQTEAVNAVLQKGTIGATLRFLNTPTQIAEFHIFYRSMLLVGGGKEQPGVALLTAWSDRNYRICAHLVQQAKPGDHVVVVYGAGHAYLLRQCIAEMPGYKLVEANDFLPK